MALGRLLARVRALVSARARGATTAAATQGGMAAAAARGRSVRACAGARARALRAQADGAARSAIACAEARARALRAQADGAARSAIACAEARARAARAFLLRAKLESGTAALMARRQLRGASDAVVSTFLRAAYGESAPMTPSPADLLERFVLLVERARQAEALISDMKKLRALFDDSELSVLLGMIFGPIILMLNNAESTAPEAICPFLGLCPLEFDSCIVRDGFDALVTVAAAGGFLIILTVSGLTMCLCNDIYNCGIAIVSVGVRKQPKDLNTVNSCNNPSLLTNKTMTVHSSTDKKLTVVLSTNMTEKEKNPETSMTGCPDEREIFIARDDEDN